MLLLCLLAGPVYADGLTSGASVGRVFDIARFQWVTGIAPFAMVEWKGAGATQTTTYDNDGILSTGFSVTYRRPVKSWMVSATYGYYKYRELQKRDAIWTITGTTLVWRWK